MRWPERLNSETFAVEERLHPARMTLETVLEGLSTAELVLGEDSGSLAIGDLVRVYDGRGEEAGVFRVKRLMASPLEGRTAAELEHALGLLGDQVIFGTRAAHDIAGLPPPQEGEEEQPVEVADALTYIIAGNQMRRRWWQFGASDFHPAYVFAYENENLLDAVLRTCQVVEEGHRLTCDFSTRPWTLNLSALPSQAECELRASRNLLSLTVETARDGFYTRVYPTGKDGLLLDAEDETGARIRHIDADTMALWGYRCALQSFPHTQDVRELRAAAASWLSARKNPLTTVTARALDLSLKTRCAQDAPRLGALCRVCLPTHGLTLTERITALRWPNLLEEPERVVVTMATRSPGAAEMLIR